MIIQINLLNGIAFGFTIVDFGEPQEADDGNFRYATNIFLMFLAVTIYHTYSDE